MFKFLLCLFFFFSCSFKNEPAKLAKRTSYLEFQKKSKKGKSTLEIELIKAGLVAIQSIDSTIGVEVLYSTNNNFVGIDLYGDYNAVYLQKEVAEKLKIAQKKLKQTDARLSLLVFDGVRPLHIQQLMWDTLKIPAYRKAKFLSNPHNHSLHNYGAAVDLTITKKGEKLDMGTPYDFMGKLAYPRLELHYLKTGELTAIQINNRKLLRNIMKQAGFSPITTEWWHFNSCSRAEAKIKYKIVL